MDEYAKREISGECESCYYYISDQCVGSLDGDQASFCLANPYSLYYQEKQKKNKITVLQQSKRHLDKTRSYTIRTIATAHQ